MHGTNPKRPPEKGDGAQLQIQEMFATLQGEGPRAGQPAVFVRLGGCNLACEFCDTEFESFSMMTMADVVARVCELAGDAEHCDVGERTVVRTETLESASARVCKLVVITGGEPLRQPIAPLCEALIAQGFVVQIETNGTIYRALPEAVEWICSPKPVGGQYFALRSDVLECVDALKFIVANHTPYESVPDVGQANKAVFVQPMDEADDVKNAANQALAIELCQRFGYRLSLQLHKMVGLP